MTYEVIEARYSNAINNNPQLKYTRLMENKSDTKPDILHLLSSSNQGQTNKIDLLQMGQNLAKEIEKFVKEAPVQSISFICHSLGGLIARSCLGGPLGIIERLVETNNVRLESFTSLSTPHLGLGLSNNILFDSGITVLKYWAECPVLHELLLEDAKIKALQNLPMLSRFTKVRLLGCKDDGYCPIESALLSYEPTGPKSSASERMTAMRTNLIKSTRNLDFAAIEVTFEEMAGSSSSSWSITGLFDSMVGRAAHINMLEDHKLADALIFAD
jgi:hypothetical protein